MLYNVFHFKSLKIVLAKTGTDTFVGYAIDSKYPEYSRPLIKGSTKEVVEVCIYLYRSRLLTAYNCDGYDWDIYGNYADMSLEDSADCWVKYVLNTYLFSTFSIYYKHHYNKIKRSYIAHDGTLCILTDYVYDGIAIKHCEE